MFIKYEHISLSMTATCSLNVCILFHLGEKTISQRTDKLHQPNVWGTPTLATISYVRDLKTRTHRWFFMAEIIAYTGL